MSISHAHHVQSRSPISAHVEKAPTYEWMDPYAVVEVPDTGGCTRLFMELAELRVLIGVLTAAEVELAALGAPEEEGADETV